MFPEHTQYHTVNQWPYFQTNLDSGSCMKDYLCLWLFWIQIAGVLKPEIPSVNKKKTQKVIEFQTQSDLKEPVLCFTHFPVLFL